MNIILKPLKNISNSLVPCPDILKAEICNTKNATGWSKCLENLPQFTIQQIEAYHNEINDRVVDKAVIIKKPFVRGNQFLVEQYIDETSIYTKENIQHFCIKGVCAASLKKEDRWIFIAINKADDKIHFAYCQCPAGKVGTCSHTYAFMKLVAHIHTR